MLKRLCKFLWIAFIHYTLQSPSSSFFSTLIKIGAAAFLDRASRWGLLARLTAFFVVRVVLKPRFTHCSRLSICATFSRLFFIMFKCLVSISMFSLSRICFNVDSSSCSFFMIDSLTLRAFRFSLIYFFSISSTLSFLSSYLSISSWFWALI